MGHNKPIYIHELRIKLNNGISAREKMTNGTAWGGKERAGVL